ncbi:MAG: PEP-CTERM sorting domain-containing protein [Burkholderiaceae bacterium]|nr:PEP-CTERM sorting domain-containing protein [Burkholderiaceae bacterium]
MIQLTACVSNTPIQFCPNNQTTGTTFGTVSSASGSSSSSVTATGGASPTISASFSTGAQGGSAGASIVYYFEVIGSSGPVTVDYAASGSVSSASTATVANYQIATTTLPFGTVLASATTSTSNPSFSVSSSLSLQTNTVYDEIMGASAGGIGTGSATLDPTLSLTPGEIAAGDQLVLSPNAVPEPSTLLFLGAGVGALAFLRVAKKRAIPADVPIVDEPIVDEMPRS